jgi:hypothetical protein
MIKLSKSISFLKRAARGLLGAMALSLLWVTGLAAAQSASTKPITKSGLTHALEIGGLTQTELVEQVTHRGVDFTVSNEVEADLRRAGADAILMKAVRENYRPEGTAGSSESSSNARTQPDSPNTSGGVDPSPSMQPVSAKQGLTLRDVRKIYIDKMPDGLDGYLRAAISQKLGGYFTIVLERHDADAILQATAPGAVSLVDPSGKILIWSGSADDKEKMYLNFRHGGQRELAEKLAGQLKKSLK